MAAIARRNCCAVGVYIVFGIAAGFHLICDLLLQPKLLSYELLDLVSSHFNLKEKEFFGLAFYDDKYVELHGCTDTHLYVYMCICTYELLMLPLDFCSGQRKWLQMDRRVLDHDFSKKSGSIALNFLVRYNFILSCRLQTVQQYKEAVLWEFVYFWIIFFWKCINNFTRWWKLVLSFKIVLPWTGSTLRTSHSWRTSSRSSCSSWMRSLLSSM